MAPKIGQKVTYVDEACQEFTAKITSVFDHNDKTFSVAIEYRRKDKSTGRVSAVPLIDGVHNKDSTQKVLCFTKKSKKPVKKTTNSTATTASVTETVAASSTSADATEPGPIVEPPGSS